MQHHHVNGTIPTWLADIRRANGDGRRMVEEAFLRALSTLDALDDPDAGRFDVRTSWPRFPRDWHAYSVDPDDAPEPSFTPSPTDIDRMLPVLAWGNGLDRRQWRIAADVAAGFSWETIGVRRHMPAEAVMQSYEVALDAVVAAALAPYPASARSAAASSLPSSPRGNKWP